MSEHGPDLWGVWHDRERLQRNLDQPLFGSWRESLDRLAETLAEPLALGADATETMRQTAE